MVGRSRGLGGVVLAGAVLVLAAGATAATPSVAAMTLQVADVPGASLSAQHSVKEQGYVAAYERDYEFASPYGSSRIVALQNEVMLAPTIAKAVNDVKSVSATFSSTAGRKLLVTEIARDAKVKPSAVVVGKVRRLAGWDSSVELPVSVKTTIGRLYENLTYLQIDRIVVVLGESALHGISAGVTAHFASLVATHVTATLAPSLTTPPTVAGTAQQGQTLTATAGIWTADDAVLTYQWQHCDAAGANCADITGATSTTYAVLPTDVGTTLRVVETATNRFGAPSSPSVQTVVVT
jgi:hypothetical protein